MTRFKLTPYRMILALLICVPLASISAQEKPADSVADEWAGPFKESIEKAQLRTVKIFGQGIGREKGYATGVLVSADGMVLTAMGIFLAGDNITGVMANGRRYDMKLIRRDDSLQVALLQLNQFGAKVETPDFYQLSDRPVVQTGDWVLAVGNWFKVADHKEKMSVNLGIVSMRGDLDVRHRRIDSPFEGDKIIIDAITSNPGAGGSALITVDGRLAGLVGKLFASKSTNTHLNYAIPAERLVDFVSGKITSPDPNKVAKQDGKPWTGIRIFTLGGRYNAAYVDKVVKGSPADKAGLKKDDQILVIGSETIQNLRAYRKHIKTLKIGEEVIILIKRNKTELIPVRLTPIAEPEDE